jgi:hypothetical protein
MVFFSMDFLWRCESIEGDKDVVKEKKWEDGGHFRLPDVAFFQLFNVPPDRAGNQRLSRIG